MNKFSFRKSILRLLDRIVINFVRRYRFVLSEAAEAASMNISSRLKLRATESTVDYVQAKMLSTRGFNHKRELLEYALNQSNGKGLFLEFGVWQGDSINFIADNTKNIVYGFDSFDGLPYDWASPESKGMFSVGGKLPSVRKNVKLYPGWFEDSLPEFVKDHDEPISFIHVDCDLYSSTKTIFKYFGSRIRSGVVILFDEYFNYPCWDEHEYKAFQEFVAEKGVSSEYIGFNRVEGGVAVRIK